MKTRLLITAAAAFLISSFSALAQSFDLSAVKTWAGNGSNEAVFVIDWHDGVAPASLAWGYRWDGTASVLDMIHAIDALDPYLTLSENPNPRAAGTIYSIFYDLNQNGSGFTLGRPFDFGGTENGFAADPADHYREGWISGYWGLLNGSGNPYNGGSWQMSEYGAASVTLSLGGFYALSFSRDIVNYTIPDASTPTAALVVPEPSSAGLIAVALAGWAALRFRRKVT